MRNYVDDDNKNYHSNETKFPGTETEENHEALKLC